MFLFQQRSNHKLCGKREVPDFILLITQRPTKYPTLIEAVIKNTKGKTLSWQETTFFSFIITINICEHSLTPLAFWLQIKQLFLESKSFIQK